MPFQTPAKSPMFKLIIFDFDGPILDSYKVAQNAVYKIRKQLIDKGLLAPEKLPFPTKETFILNWGYPGMMTLKRMFPKLETEDVKMFIEAWARNERKHNLKPIPGAIKTLKYLKQKGFLNVLLTSRSINLKIHLQPFLEENIFDIIQSWRNPDSPTKETIHQNHIYSSAFKPNSEVLKEIISWAGARGISKDEMLMVDDALVGLETARSAGIIFLGVCTGPVKSREYWLKYGELHPSQVINTIRELPSWLKHKSARL